MHLNTNIQVEQDFAKWQLEVGQGEHTDENCNVSLPEHFKCPENTVDSLIDSIYPGIATPDLPPQYFSERTILSSINVKDLGLIALTCGLPGLRRRHVTVLGSCALQGSRASLA